MGSNGLEPSTSRLSGARSNHLSYAPMYGGDEEVRTPDPLRARQVLSQLSYTPISRLKVLHLVGTSGLEPPTSRLSGVRSNHLSYAPVPFAFSKYRLNDIFKIEQRKY